MWINNTTSKWMWTHERNLFWQTSVNGLKYLLCEWMYLSSLFVILSCVIVVCCKCYCTAQSDALFKYMPNFFFLNWITNGQHKLEVHHKFWSSMASFSPQTICRFNWHSDFFLSYLFLLYQWDMPLFNCVILLLMQQLICSIYSTFKVDY